MPNHIKNRLTLSGDEKSIAELVSSYTTFIKSEGEEWTRFPDFEKIVPMPDTLHCEVHSGITTAVENSLKTDVGNGILGALRQSNREVSKSPLEFSDNDWSAYIQCLNNMRQYGHATWYEWSIENWGTKWNAYACEKISDTIFEFDTAWSSVSKLIEKISKKFPTVGICYEYADEDTGANCGRITYLNGEKDSYYPVSQSKEAYELAFSLRPDYAENYKLVGESYEYIDND